MHCAESFKGIQYSFSVSKYAIRQYSHPEVMICKIFSFYSASINVYILFSMVHNGSKSLLLFCIMPTNAPHKIHIINQYIIPTCFSENTPSSVSPETHCSNILTIYVYLLWRYYKRKNGSKMHGMNNCKIFSLLEVPITYSCILKMLHRCSSQEQLATESCQTILTQTIHD